MGQPPPNQEIGRMMASCTLRMHLRGLMSINLLVLVVVLLLDGENFLFHEEDVFMPILGMPLEETFCSCLSDFLQSKSKEVFL
jgi:hypothetical protein